MTDLTLRPLSLGEILDRAFSLYRNRFVLFVGIAAIPHVILLIIALLGTFETKPVVIAAPTGVFPSIDPGSMIFSLFYLVVATFASLFSLGGIVLAVSELYLGRPISITESLQRAWGKIGVLFGVTVLSSLAVGGALILLIVPGLYVACRLLVCVPAALVEGHGAGASVSRSFSLTKSYAGRGFAILLLSVVLAWAAQAMFALPFSIPLALSASNPVMLRFWQAIVQVSSSIATILVVPIPYIAISIFYYDLRVRKEAFDLQFMMNPGAQLPPDASGMPSIAS